MVSNQRLIIVWVVLMALTVGTGLSGRVTVGEALPVAFLAVMGLVSMIKARLILSDFLQLKQAPGWLSAFSAILILLCAVVYGLLAAA